MKNIWEAIKNFVLNTLGHAVSGFGVGALFEIEQLIVNGSAFTFETLLLAAGIGGSVGFFKAIVEQLEKLKKTTASKKGNGKTKKDYFI